MLGELEQRQIAALIREGVPDDEIARQMDIEPALVKLVASKNGADRDIDDDQLAILRKHAFNLALGASDDSTQARMTMFLLERDRPSKKSSEASPIALINNAIIAANDAFEKLTANINARPIVQNFPGTKSLELNANQEP